MRQLCECEGVEWGVIFAAALAAARRSQLYTTLWTEQGSFVTCPHILHVYSIHPLTSLFVIIIEIQLILTCEFMIYKNKV